jgi:hypothetical protein
MIAGRQAMASRREATHADEALRPVEVKVTPRLRGRQ